MKATLVVVTAALLALSACGTSAADKAAQSDATANATTTASGAASYPVKVKSCDEELTFEKAPERVLILGGTDFPILDELGLLSHVTAQTGKKNYGPELKDLQDKLYAIPAVSSTEQESGGAIISVESVLNAKADLVIGYDSAIDRAKLKEAGVSLYSPDAYCPNYSVTKATWGLVDDEITKIGTIFGVPDRAAKLIEKQHSQTAQIKAADLPAGTTAATLYITPGSTTFYAYGTSSMVEPILQTNKLTNTYADKTKRIFDGSMEDLLKRNPDWIVLLALDATDKEVTDTFLGFNGAKELKAVTNKHIVVLPFALTDPPTTLSVLGGVNLAKKVDTVK